MYICVDLLCVYEFLCICVYVYIGGGGGVYLGDNFPSKNIVMRQFSRGQFS